MVVLQARANASNMNSDFSISMVLILHAFFVAIPKQFTYSYGLCDELSDDD